MPIYQEWGRYWKAIPGKHPTDYPDISLEHAVLIGAAKRAEVMQYNARHGGEYCTSILDPAPSPMGVETAGGIVTNVSGGTEVFHLKRNCVHNRGRWIERDRISCTRRLEHAGKI